jgi:hypothetical protein
MVCESQVAEHPIRQKNTKRLMDIIGAEKQTKKKQLN